MRKYKFSDFTTGGKPRIKRETRRFGERVYAYRCDGLGAWGWGTTPADSYNAWRRNWRRRVRFYGERAGQYDRVEELLS